MILGFIVLLFLLLLIDGHGRKAPVPFACHPAFARPVRSRPVVVTEVFVVGMEVLAVLVPLVESPLPLLDSRPVLHNATGV